VTVQGVLEVKCDQTEYEALQTQQEEMSAGTTDERQSLVTPNQSIKATTGSSSNHENVTVIQLTRHQRHGTPLPQAAMGMDGLRNLLIAINCRWRSNDQFGGGRGRLEVLCQTFRPRQPQRWQ
jgi:hypothetical protein